MMYSDHGMNTFSRKTLNTSWQVPAFTPAVQKQKHPLLCMKNPPTGERFTIKCNISTKRGPREVCAHH